MKKHRSHLRLGSYNINGFKDKIDTANLLIETEKLDILALQETKLAPSYSFPTGRQYEAASITRSRHGLAISIAPDIKYSRLFDIHQDGGQALAIRIEDLTIINIYVRPSKSKKQLYTFLDTINKEVKGRAVIIGDWNARHPSWDASRNNLGTQLFKWINQKEWNIYAPDTPTHYHILKNGESSATTIDFAITRMGRLDFIQAKDGPWDGASDHKPIVARVHCQRNRMIRKRRIPIRRRSKEELIQIFTETIPSKAQEITALIMAATNQQELDQAYWKLVQIIINPFKPRGKIPSLRARYFWSNELERMSKRRSRFYNRYTVTRDLRDYARYRQYNRRLRRKSQKARTKSYNQYRREFEEAPPTEASKRISGLVKKKRKNIEEATPRTTAGLERRKFTHFVSLKFPPRVQDTPVPPQKFILTKRMENLISMAALVAPRGKAAGIDETFGEIFRIIPEVTTPILIALWRKCGELAIIPTLWKKFHLVALYKKGDTTDPSNYRPIALISHMRKIIEKALDLELKSCTRFHRFQCGFRARKSTESATLRFLAAKQMGHHYTAVLDLRGAYPSVPRAQLMEVLRSRLPDQICDEISLFMGDDAISTIGDPESLEATVRMGVPEGSPLSPSIFNIYIDVLANRLDKTPQKYSNLPATLYADDVVLFAKTAAGLQILLDICTKWAADYGMHWATTKGKSCVVIPPTSRTTFTLAGNNVERQRTTRYLGIIVNFRGIQSADTPKRIAAARAKYSLIAATKILDRIHVRRQINIYNTFIRPVFDFGIHLAPWRHEYEADSRAVDNMVFKHPHRGAGKRAWVRFRNVLGIPSLETRRRILASKLYERLTANMRSETDRSPAEKVISQWEITALLQIHELPDLLNPEAKETEERAVIEQKLAAQTNTTKHRLCAVHGAKQPYLKTPATIARMAIRWFFGKFPHHAQKEQLLRDPTINYTSTETELQRLLHLPDWNETQRNKCIKLIISVAKATDEYLGNAEDGVEYSEPSSTTTETMSSTEKSFDTASWDSRESKATD